MILHMLQNVQIVVLGAAVMAEVKKKLKKIGTNGYVDIFLQKNINYGSVAEEVLATD